MLHEINIHEKFRLVPAEINAKHLQSTVLIPDPTAHIKL